MSAKKSVVRLFPNRILVASIGGARGTWPAVIELYRQLKLQGALEGITEVMELGSQDFWCPQKNLMTGRWFQVYVSELLKKKIVSLNAQWFLPIFAWLVLFFQSKYPPAKPGALRKHVV